MNIIVEKYGGTSLASIEQVKAVAQHIVHMHNNGYAMVIVVSAMGDTTDQLVALVDEISLKPNHREFGMLLSTGEMVSCSLLALAIQAHGINATSLTGAQAGVNTDRIYTNARITDIDTTRIMNLLAGGEIVVITGFQGKVGDDITVLGRGGSDASAVAIAAALKTDECYIYTDVAGVFTADPRLVPEASLLAVISYEEMIELAASGAKVMMSRSVEIARNYQVNIHVCSSSHYKPGTLITKEEKLEKVLITGVAANKNVAMIDIYGINKETGDFAQILNEIAARQVNIILLCSNQSETSHLNLSLIIKPDDIIIIKEILENFQVAAKISRLVINNDVAQVSIVGSGVANHAGVAFNMFNALSRNDINILMTSTSEIKITAIIPKNRADDAVRFLHDAFELHLLTRNCREEKIEQNQSGNSWCDRDSRPAVHSVVAEPPVV